MFTRARLICVGLLAAATTAVLVGDRPTTHTPATSSASAPASHSPRVRHSASSASYR
jgi:hypothetical protein